MTVVLAVRVAHIEESVLKAGGVTLGHGDREAEHARRGGKVELEAEGDSIMGGADDKIGVRCGGPAQRKRKDGRKSEQTGCNHVEGALRMKTEGTKGTTVTSRGKVGDQARLD